MPIPRLRCAIEQIVDWHFNLFVEAHVVAFVAIASKYSESPAVFDVECSGIESRWLRHRNNFKLEISWHYDTQLNAGRLRSTIQSRPLIEMAAIAVSLILTKRLLALGTLDVTDYGERADYRSRKQEKVIEVSGTEVPAELNRRVREKLSQAKENPFGWDGFVSITAFSAPIHQLRLSAFQFSEV